MTYIQEKYRKDFTMKSLIANTPKDRPYVDPTTGRVFWGVSAEQGKREKHEGNKD